ncbi:MAG: DUF2802 domain-containing protein [Planctomycetaceae bacterium]|nr:DUF2802 domain-containing protein [Planctomycetaceae bacterium]
MLHQHASFSEIGVISGGTPDNVTPFFPAQVRKNPPEIDCSNNIPTHIPTAGSSLSRQATVEQFEVELLTFSRQINAEIDTKIVALQLMIADADRVMQQWEKILPHIDKTAPSIQLTEPERVHIIKSDETDTESSVSQKVPVPQNNVPSNDPADFKNIIIEDPFAVNDFGFDKAMRDLDQLTASLPTFNAWDTPISESSSSGMSANTEVGQNRELPLSPLPEWDSPVSYPISDYRSAQEQPPDELLHGRRLLPDQLSPGLPSRRKTTYTNKLLTQVPPQLDMLMTDEPVRKMGSKPLRIIRQESTPPADDEPLAPPVIPKLPPPNAQAILVESAPFSQAEVGLDKIAVRKAKRHQLQYLIEKGLSPKEIAAHLEMPVGEVELIFSLHKRLSGESAKPVRQPLTDTPAPISTPPTRRPRVISAENVVMGDREKDGEQVAG